MEPCGRQGGRRCGHESSLHSEYMTQAGRGGKKEIRGEEIDSRAVSAGTWNRSKNNIQLRYKGILKERRTLLNRENKQDGRKGIEPERNDRYEKYAVIK